MEDVADALKLSASVFIFVAALTIVFMMFSQAREVSTIVLNYSDNTYLAEYSSANGDANGRTVGIETVIPTLYKYYKGKYTIDIVKNDNVQELFDLEEENKYKRRNYDDNNVYSIIRNNSTYSNIYKNLYPDDISWLGKSEDELKRTNVYISGNVTDEVNSEKLNKYGNYNLKDLKNKNFIEYFNEKISGEEKVTKEDGSTIYRIKGQTKIHVTYIVNE